MKKKALFLALVAVLVFAFAATAYATVTFQPSNDTGFVGKGDVQLVLGMNNAQIQNAALSLAFTYAKTDMYEVVNAWASGNVDNPASLSAHLVTVTTVVGVNDTVACTIRNNPKSDVTGFNLTGVGSSVTNGTLPVVSPTVTYTTYSWDEQVRTGWVQVPVYDKNGVLKGYKNGDPIYETVHHTSDQVPVDENGNLYTEGDDKAVLSVDLVSSVGTLNVGGMPLLWPAPVLVP